MYACMYVCARMCVHACACMHASLHICVYVYTYMIHDTSENVYMFIYVCMYMTFLYIYTYVYLGNYMYSHTYMSLMHIYMYGGGCKQCSELYTKECCGKRPQIRPTRDANIIIFCIVRVPRPGLHFKTVIYKPDARNIPECLRGAGFP